MAVPHAMAVQVFTAQLKGSKSWSYTERDPHRQQERPARPLSQLLLSGGWETAGGSYLVGMGGGYYN